MRFATQKMRVELWLRSDGRCNLCGEVVRFRDLHADHVIPHSKGGPTEPLNLQLLCKRCNFKKGSRSMSSMLNKIPALRGWQDTCFGEATVADWFKQSSLKSVLSIDVSPGGGKTIFGITSWLEMKSRGVCKKLVVIVPSRDLRRQWQRQCQGYGVRLASRHMADIGDPDIDGIVLTYAAVCSSPNAFIVACRDSGINPSDVFLICDEYHRVSLSKITGEKLAIGFSSTGKKLLMSGTFFRTDSMAMPWIDYEPIGDDGRSRAITDYRYSMGQAISDEVLRSVEFCFLDGEASFIDANAPLADPEEIKYSEAQSSYDESRIIDSLVSNRNNLIKFLSLAVDKLRCCQKVNPDDKGGVVVSTVEHASRVQRALRDLGVQSTVVVTPGEQDDDGYGDLRDESDKDFVKADNDRLMDEFRNGRGGDFIISVAMLREGTDLPDWRVMVYLSRCRALLSFKQFIARCMRMRCQCDSRDKSIHYGKCDIATGATNAYIFVPRTPTFELRVKEVLDEKAAAMEEKRMRGPNQPGDDPRGAAVNPRVLQKSESDEIYSTSRNGHEVNSVSVSIVLQFAERIDREDPSRSLGSKLRGMHGNDEMLLLLKAARNGVEIEFPLEPIIPEPIFIPPISPEEERRQINDQMGKLANRIGHIRCSLAGVAESSPDYGSIQAVYRNDASVEVNKRMKVEKWKGEKHPLSSLRRRLEIFLEIERQLLGKIGA